ncbi:hypothetical protein EW145_g5141 [Phellinidium pouzarii]|uniref:Uncharacterized protein n=1 Tax=Phellinidium pouzarii TaxID=167371 RepID=A0A4S4L5U3_9AGAM|nr:hypothetical protein EW145_g5141 [Phellinidium pouzarii]
MFNTLTQTSQTSNFPSELVWEIVSWMMVTTPNHAEELGPSTHLSVRFCKPRWTVMDNFSKASKAFRIVALGNWFRSVCIRKSSDWEVISLDFPYVYQCARSVQWHSSGTDELEEAYSGFAKFKNVVIAAIFLSLDTDADDLEVAKILRILPSSIRELEVFDAVYPDPKFIKLIAETFPDLHALRLVQPSVWCNVCYLCNIPGFAKESPDNLKIIYSGSHGLPGLYAQQLSRLQKLHTVQFTIAVLAFQDIRDFDDEGVPFAWSGECTQCRKMIESDKVFRTEWAEKKKDFDIVASNLKLVEWNFVKLSRFGNDWTNRILYQDLYNVDEGSIEPEDLYNVDKLISSQIIG